MTVTIRAIGAGIDRFDGPDKVQGTATYAFEQLVAQVPEEWLRALGERTLSEEEKRKIEALGGWDKLLETLRERLREQKERHNVARHPRHAKTSQLAQKLAHAGEPNIGAPLDETTQTSPVADAHRTWAEPGRSPTALFRQSSGQPSWRWRYLASGSHPEPVTVLRCR